MQFRVLYNNAYEHTQIVLNLCNRLGFRGDATAEAKTLVMLADAACKQKTFPKRMRMQCGWQNCHETLRLSKLITW